MEIAAQHLAKKRNGIVASLKVDSGLRSSVIARMEHAPCAAPELAANVSSAMPWYLGRGR